VHTYRQQPVKTPKDRPHFPAIIAFVYRNRFAVASQIQRRFSQFLPSARTARRHLQEMETLKYIDTVPGPSPLWPKTYFVTRRGTRTLQDAFTAKGKAWTPTLIDRSRGNGFSTNHVLHELFITELLLTQWENVQRRDDLELLTVERRSLVRHPAFRITMAGRPTRLVPDAMLLLRYAGKGMMCWFVEMDMGTMNEQQWHRKCRRYESWSRSEQGQHWLTELYACHGAKNPRPLFRILIVANDEHRKTKLMELGSEWMLDPRNRWLFTSVGDLSNPGTDLASCFRS